MPHVPDLGSVKPHTLLYHFCQIILILSSHLRLGLPSDSFLKLNNPQTTTKTVCLRANFEPTTSHIRHWHNHLLPSYFRSSSRGDVRETEISLPDLRFTQLYRWGLGLVGCEAVSLGSVPDVSKDCSAFIFHSQAFFFSDCSTFHSFETSRIT